MNSDRMREIIRHLYGGIFDDKAWLIAIGRFDAEAIALAQARRARSPERVSPTYDRDAVDNRDSRAVSDREYLSSHLYQSACANSSPQSGRPLKRRVLPISDHQEFSELTDHVALAKKIRGFIKSIERLEALRAMASDKHKTKVATFIVDADLKVLESDTNAKQFFPNCDGLALRHGSLISLSKTDGQNSKSLKTYVGDATPSSRPMVVEGRHDTIFRLRVLRVIPSENGDEKEIKKALSVSVTSLSKPLNISEFAAVFGLTSAESRFLVELANADNSAQAADKLGISRNTAKKHVAHILHKTNCGSQNQLMLLLGRFSA